MDIKFLFNPDDASDDDLRRLAVDAVYLLGLPSAHEFGLAVFTAIEHELEIRSWKHAADRDRPKNEEFKMDIKYGR